MVRVDLSSAIHESIGKVNFSDVEEFCDSMLRRYILGKSKNMSEIIEDILAQWKEVRPQHREEMDH